MTRRAEFKKMSDTLCCGHEASHTLKKSLVKQIIFWLGFLLCGSGFAGVPVALHHCGDVEEGLRVCLGKVSTQNHKVRPVVVVQERTSSGLKESIENASERYDSTTQLTHFRTARWDLRVQYARFVDDDTTAEIYDLEGRILHPWFYLLRY